MASDLSRWSSIARMMYVVLLIAVALAVAIGVGRSSVALLVTLVVILAVSAVAGTIVYMLQRRGVNRWAMLTVMELATRYGMPLGPGLSAFATLCGGGMRRRAASLAYLLDGGTPLGRAIRRVPGILPGPTAALVAVGSEQGDTAEALRQAEESAEAQKTQWARLVPNLVYVVCVLFGFLVVISFCLYFIMPKFEAIFADFGVDLPPTTTGVIRFSHWALRYGPLAVLGLMVASLVLWFGVMAAWWDVPVVSRLFASRDRASVLRGLSVGAAAGRPFESVIAAFEATYPRAWMRRRLRRARRGLEAGESWMQALRAGRLISGADAALLEAAQGAGNLPWALETLAGSLERRLSYRLDVAMQVAFPAVIGMIGLSLLIWSMAFFVPLVELIRRLAG